jgi:hypothetical protein
MHTTSNGRAAPFHLECGAISAGADGLFGEVGLQPERWQTRDRIESSALSRGSCTDQARSFPLIRLGAKGLLASFQANSVGIIGLNGFSPIINLTYLH